MNIEKFIYQLSYYSYSVVKWVFNLSFLGMIFYYIIYGDVPPTLLYIFLIITGINIGFALAIGSMKYLKNIRSHH